MLQQKSGFLNAGIILQIKIKLGSLCHDADCSNSFWKGQSYF